MRAAALDLGTNSFLCLIAEVPPSAVSRSKETPKILDDKIEITRLGEGVHKSRLFSPDALKRAEAAFHVFRKQIDQHKVDIVQAVATSAARDVKNAHELFALGAKYDIPIEIISGEKEAQLTFEGVNFGKTHIDETVVIDVGGGSTEVVYAHPKESTEVVRRSLDIGAVRLTEMFVHAHPVPADEMKAMSDYVLEQLKNLKFKPRAAKILAVAGTPTSLAAAIQGIDFDPVKIDGFQITEKVLNEWVYKLASMTLDQRAGFSGIGPKRADVIVAGALILDLVLKAMHANELHVSTKGLRYGLVEQLLKGTFGNGKT